MNQDCRTEESQLVLPSEEKRMLYITDITIKPATAQDAKETEICLDEAQPAIVLKIEQGNLLRLETMSPTGTIDRPTFELPLDTVKCILSIGTEDQYMGHAFIMKSDLEGLTLGRELKHRFDRQLIMRNDTPLHLVSFTITTIPMDQADSQCGDDNAIAAVEERLPEQLALDMFLLGKVIHFTMASTTNITFPLAGNVNPDLLNHKMLNKCGDIFLDRSTKGLDRQNHDYSIRSYNLALHMLPNTDHPSHIDYQCDVAMVYSNRFQLFKQISDSDRAQSMLESAINNTPEGDPKLRNRLRIQCSASQARFRHTNQVRDISSVISSYQRLVKLYPKDDADLPALLNNLGVYLKTRFALTGDVADISDSISLTRRAIQLSTYDDGTFLVNLGLSLQARFEHGRDIKDISEAILSFRDALKHSPAANTEASTLKRQTSLAVALRLRFENGDKTNTADISEAISLLQTAVKATPKGHDELSVRLGNLGLALLCEFDHATGGGEIANLSEAISSFQQAIDLTPKEDPFLPVRLNNLGNALRQRFHHSTKNPEDLSEAVSLYRRAIELSESTASSRDLHFWHNNLGVVLTSCFECSGDIGELSESVSSFRKALMFAPKNDPHVYGRRLNNLGHALLWRFRCGGVISDLSEAITLLRQAAENPDALLSLHMAVVITNLSLALEELFKLHGDNGVLSEAISQQYRAIKLTPPGHAYLPSQLNGLGSLLLTRFDHSKGPKDLSEAITSFQEAIRLSDGWSSQPGWINNLAIGFRRRFELDKDKNLSDVKEAISLHEKAIRLTPAGHPDLSRWHNSLGSSLQTLHKHTKDQAHITSAISHYHQAAISTTGMPSERLVAAQKWAQCSQQYDLPQALEAYGTVINLLSEFVGMNEPMEARHASVGGAPDLASAAAAAAFSCGRIELALEWLEQGRCIVWTQLGQLQKPQHDLHVNRPDLAKRFQRVSNQLEKSGFRDLQALAMTESPEKKLSLEDEAVEHIKYANEWNQLLEEIRCEPGFSAFLRPRKTLEILALLPLDGPVVLINVHENQCHVLALIPSHEAPVAIPLQRITRQWAVDLWCRLTDCLSSADVRRDGYRAARKEMSTSESFKNILRALWIDLVKPIFDAIGFHEPSSQGRRIWWCATGPLAFLPIHAAGIYEAGGTCVADFAISSYIPNLATLIDKNKIKEPAAPSILLVSQARAPNFFPIPGADTEAEKIMEIVQGCDLEVLRLTGEDATTIRLTEEMPSYKWIHLACHGSQHLTRPLKSAFHMLDGQLDVSEIIKLQIPNADFAFLSACQTSTGGPEVSDEAVHLAAGMLAAGYRSVVSTMWSIQDKYGPEVAESFYSYLLKGVDKLQPRDGASAAHALHYATQRLRKKLGDTDQSLLIWVPYVHFGI